MDKEKLINVLEAILFASGKEVEIDFLLEKLQISRVAFEKALKSLQDKYSGDCGINVIKFKNKLQFATNPKYIDDVAEVLNPIREKELTKAMLETLSIIAYKQPITRLEIEEIRGVDCTYAVQTLSKMNMQPLGGAGKLPLSLRHDGRVFEKIFAQRPQRPAEFRVADRQNTDNRHAWRRQSVV